MMKIYCLLVLLLIAGCSQAPLSDLQRELTATRQELAKAQKKILEVQAAHEFSISNSARVIQELRVRVQQLSTPK